MLRAPSLAAALSWQCGRLRAPKKIIQLRYATARSARRGFYHARKRAAPRKPRSRSNAARTARASPRSPNGMCQKPERCLPCEREPREKKPHKQVGQGNPPSQSLYPRNPKPAAKQGSRKKQARRGRGSLACAMRPYRASLASLACLARAPPLRSTSCVVARPPKRLPATASSAGCARARRVLGSLARAPPKYLAKCLRTWLNICSNC